MSITNPETIEPIATKIEQDLKAFYAENKELDGLVEMEKIAESETELLKLLEDCRQDYLSRGGNYPTLVPKEKEEIKEEEPKPVDVESQEEVKEVEVQSTQSKAK